MELQPLIDIAGGGMRYESKDVGFHATLNITVIDMKGPMEVKPLPFPVRLLVSADVDRTDPSGAFDITETFSFHEVDLYAMSPANTVRVRVLPSFLSTPVQLDMKVIRLPINIYVTPARIQGFGLQTASITVEVDGLRDPTTATIVLNTDRGRLEKTQMALDSNGIATVGIRSLSIGEAKITARYSPAGTAEATLTFDVPWLFAGAAVVGGLFGSGIRLLVERKKRLSGRVISCRLLRGTLLGILVAAAYSVGVNLSGINFPATWSGAEEGFTFVIAGLVAHAGRIKIPSSPT